MPPEPLDHIFPGSWINANFDIWIGAEEDNQAWTQLLRARSTYDAATGVPEDSRRLAYEELLIAEGSDWCWWYGPEHDSANRIEFDQLYRSHLANVYRFLNLAPPEELSRPILRIATPDVRMPPTGAIHPTIDGEVTSYFEWMGAGEYHVDERSGSMHGKKFLVNEVFFGSDGESLFVRVDFRPGSEPELAGMEARFSLQSLDGAPPQPVTIRLASGAADQRRPGGVRLQPHSRSALPPGRRRRCRRPRRAIPAFPVARRPPGGRRPAAGLAGDAHHQPRGNGGLASRRRRVRL